MKNLISVLVVVVSVFNPLAYAQSSKAELPPGVASKIQRLIQERKEKIASERKEMALLAKQLEKLKIAKDEAETVGVLAALGAGVVIPSTLFGAIHTLGAWSSLNSKQRVFRAVALVIGAGSSLGGVAFLVGQDSKEHALKNTIQKAEEAIEDYQNELSRDLGALDALEMQFTLTPSGEQEK